MNPVWVSTGWPPIDELNCPRSLRHCHDLDYDRNVLGRRLRSPLVGVTVGLSVLIPVGIASAVPPDEAYPPAAVVNLLDPFGCAPDSITGDVGEVLAGSTVSLELVMAGEVLSTATATADAGGHAEYTIPVPPDRFGPVVVSATGTNTVNAAIRHRDLGHHRRLPASASSDGRLGFGYWLRGGAAPSSPASPLWWRPRGAGATH